MLRWLHPSLAITVAPATDDDGELFGKNASDLQENVVVSNSGISGTLKYVSDYSSAFSGSEAYGNYLALKCEAEEGATISVELVGGVHGPVTLDPDGLIVIRVTSNGQSVKVVATKSGISETKTYALTGLTFVYNDDKSVSSVKVENVSATEDANHDWNVTLPQGTTSISAENIDVVLHAPNAEYTISPEGYSDLVGGDVKAFNLRVVAQDGTHENYQINCTIAE